MHAAWYVAAVHACRLLPGQCICTARKLGILIIPVGRQAGTLLHGKEVGSLIRHSRRRCWRH
jgi:hypothetical protein